MSKPLELKIYPPLAKQPLPFDPDWQGWDAWREWKRLYDQEFQQRRDARLTDAELAAEAYRQIGLGNEAMALFYKAILDGDNAAADQQDTHVDRLVEQARTLTRLATNPHYFEVDQ